MGDGLCPVVWRWSGTLFGCTVSLVILTMLEYVRHGTWRQSPVIMGMEYLPVIAFLVPELAGGQGGPAARASEGGAVVLP